MNTGKLTSDFLVDMARGNLPPGLKIKRRKDGTNKVKIDGFSVGIEGNKTVVKLLNGKYHLATYEVDSVVNFKAGETLTVQAFDGGGFFFTLT